MSDSHKNYNNSFINKAKYQNSTTPLDKIYQQLGRGDPDEQGISGIYEREGEVSDKNTQITAYLIPFNYEDRGTIKEDVPFLNKSNERNHEVWTFWKDEILDKSHVKYTSDDNYLKNEQYNLIENELLHNIIKQICNMYHDLYTDNNNWVDNILPKIGRIDDIPVFEKDPLFAQKIRIPDIAQILMIGDIHSTFHSLGDIIDKNRDMFEGDSLTLKRDKYIIFLGDIVDRGPYNMELLYFVFLLKLKNQQNVFIINGNHENEDQWDRVNDTLGNELSFNNYPYLHKLLLKKCLYYLPSVIYLQFNNKIYHLSHGAFDPYLGGLSGSFLYKYPPENFGIKTNTVKNITDFLNLSQNLWYITDDFIYDESTYKGETFDQFKWGDMMQKDGYIQRIDRSKFGSDKIKEYLRKNNIECIISGHQDMIPLGIIVQNPTNDLNINGTQFCHWSGYADKNMVKLKLASGEHDESRIRQYYDFYVPCIDYKNGLEDYTIRMRPDTDFIALVTSTATVSREVFVTYNCYLMMGVVNGSASQGGGSYKNNNYKMKYLKYKAKYLKLRSN